MGKVKNLFTKENIVKSLKWFFFSYIWLAVLMFIIDIVSKTLVKVNMNLGESIPLIPDFLSITYVHNHGMAFGIDFNNQVANTIVFISVSVIGAIIIGYIIIKYWKKLGQVGKASLMLMISGTIGNLIDRAFYVDAAGDHFVVDFIHFQFFGWSFPVFNIADSALVVGTIMLLIYLLAKDAHDSKVKAAKEALVTQEQLDKANQNNDADNLKNDSENNVENKEGNVDKNEG